MISLTAFDFCLGVCKLKFWKLCKAKVIKCELKKKKEIKLFWFEDAYLNSLLIVLH